MLALKDALAARPYPGRGCLGAMTRSGRLVFVYCLTGRSPLSRNREFVLLPDRAIGVRATGGDTSDPLRHYAAAVCRGDWTVVGNGDQVQPIAGALAAGRAPTEAAANHTYEPDPPIYTTRIWLAHQAGRPSFHVGFAERSDRDSTGANVVVWEVRGLRAGEGVLMTTYAGTSDAVVRATHPVDIAVLATTAAELAEQTWSALSDAVVRVGAFAIESGRLDLAAVLTGPGPTTGPSTDRLGSMSWTPRN